MLTSLSIKNYALIEELSVNFHDNLSIITGETGAGKSILLGALGLALGNRADSSTLKSTNTKCIIEAQFNVEKYNLEKFFEQNDVDFENNTIVRREILPSGKSRAFINDTPTTLNVLQGLSEQLIDVHSQHQTLQLSDTNFQFEIIDSIGNNHTKIESYKRGLKLFQTLKKEIEVLKIEQNKAREQYSYNIHLYEELKSASFKKGEQEKIEQELDKLNNIEVIKLNLSEVQSLSFNEEIGLQNLLNSLLSKLRNISEFSKEYNQLANRIESVKIEFDDVVSEIENLNDTLEFDASSLDKLNERYQLLLNLQKKHLVTSIEELLKIEENLSVKVDVVQNASFEINKKEKELKEIGDKIDKLANNIFKARKKAIPNFIKNLESILAYLGMDNTKFKIDLTHTNEYLTSGKDALNFQISSNNGINYGSLKKIASGGEMSRIMLAIKSILSSYKNLSTIIFDEIDSGVSGDISQKMAEIMSNMAENLQVITITHLPQIASKGKQHYKVYKRNINNNIDTQLKQLNEDERIVEIAEMLSGKDYAETAIEHAKQLLN